MAEVAPAAAEGVLPEIHSSGTPAVAARIPAEAVLNQEVAESPSVGHPSVESPAAAAAGECCPSVEGLLKAAAECCPSEAVLLKAAAGSPSSRARP